MPIAPLLKPPAVVPTGAKLTLKFDWLAWFVLRELTSTLKLCGGHIPGNAALKSIGSRVIETEAASADIAYLNEQLVPEHKFTGNPQ